MPGTVHTLFMPHVLRASPRSTKVKTMSPRHLDEKTETQRSCSGAKATGWCEEPSLDHTWDRPWGFSWVGQVMARLPRSSIRGNEQRKMFDWWGDGKSGFAPVELDRGAVDNSVIASGHLLVNRAALEMQT